MGISNISIFSTHNLPAITRELDHLWSRFLENQKEETLLGRLRQNVLDSWKRCQKNGVNPLQDQTKPALSSFELKHLQKNTELFLLAKPIMDEMFYKMTGSGYLATLADANGRIIYLKGETPIVKEAEKMNFAAGMDWNEQAAGTNAIGTSIVTKTPIQIFSAEHFCRGCHPWSCASAPITHPFTQKIIGAVDFTSLRNNAHPHTLGLALSVARDIEIELSHAYERVNNVLTEAFYKGVSKWKNDAIFVINEAYVVVKSCEVLQESLKLSPGTNLSNDETFCSLADKMDNYFGADDPLNCSELLFRDFHLLSIERIFCKGKIAGYLLVLNKTKTANKFHFRITSQDGPWKELVGQSEPFLTALSKCYKAAQSDVPILLLGESGTGKEKIAHSIHKSSNRSDQPFLAINCGAIPKEIIGSELFGYEKGTFTGGVKEGKKGRFEEADGGTIFLDEIGEMPLDLQVHLLRVLQEKEITRLGSSKPITVDIRILAATNKNLFHLCKKGLFREDLFFRLNVVTVHIPPLRERKQDLSPLIDYFLNNFANKYEKPSFSITEEARKFLFQYHWPGNVRELQNVLEYAAIFSESSSIVLKDLPSYLFDHSSQHFENNKPMDLPLMNLEEKKIVIRLLEETNWNLSAVARKMNIARTTLYRKLKKYELR